MGLKRLNPVSSLAIFGALMIGSFIVETVENSRIYVLCGSSIFSLTRPSSSFVSVSPTSSPFTIRSQNFGVGNYSSDLDSSLLLESGAELLVVLFFYTGYNTSPDIIWRSSGDIRLSELETAASFLSTASFPQVFGTELVQTMRSFNSLNYLLYFGLLAVAHGGVVAPTCTASGTCPKNYCCLRDPEWDDVNKACAPLSKVDSEHNLATPLWPSCCYREVQGRHQRPACIVKCYVSNNELLAEYRSSVYNNACPCEKGYVCRGLHDFSLKGICVKEYSSNTDCPGDRCCATMSSPGIRGKRSQGICRQLGTANETCFVEDKINDVVKFLCPCASGFSFQGNGAVAGLFPTRDRGVCVPVDTNDKAIPGK